MPVIGNEVVVPRPLDAVFDAATTAAHWPDWHPATLRVEGDVDHPARLGDRIVEHVSIGGRDGSGTWTVVEDERPHRLVLTTPSPAGELRITYTLTTEPEGTRFRRELSHPPLGPVMDAAMAAQSAAAVERLGELLERLIP